MASVDASSCQISEKSSKLYYWLYFILFGPMLIINKIRYRLSGGEELAECFCNCCEAAADSATGSRRRYRLSRGCCPCCCCCC